MLTNRKAERSDYYLPSLMVDTILRSEASLIVFLGENKGMYQRITRVKGMTVRCLLLTLVAFLIRKKFLIVNSSRHSNTILASCVETVL
jgi:hypothetical protein